MSRFLELGFRALFVVAAVPAVLRAARRLHRLEGRLPMDLLCDRLRRARPFRLSLFQNPRYLAGTVDRLLPLLPPRHLGACFRRALLLQDLWARCGLDPRLSLGLAAGGGERRLHAWACREPDAPAPEGEAYRELWQG